ncbi:hypothetical protein BDV18DRAFT_25119 [Aspergillus unguis]
MLSALLSVSLCAIVYLLSTKMSNPASPNLEIRLQSPSVPPSFSPPIALSIKLSVVNRAESPATVLTWNSPLDPKANILIPFEIRNTDTDEVVQLDTIKFARQLPPPKEDFSQIPPGGEVHAEVTLPIVPLYTGQKYTIRAKGWWQAVWESPIEDVPDYDLKRLAGALRGEFESEAVPIEVHE